LGRAHGSKIDGTETTKIRKINLELLDVQTRNVTEWKKRRNFLIPESLFLIEGEV
jgi:hypothetical protein